MKRKEYLNSIALLSHKFASVFNDVWWGSLVHEKNPNKSYAVHLLLLDKEAQCKRFFLLFCFFDLIKKILSVIFMSVYFRVFKLRIPLYVREVIFDYGLNHLTFLNGICLSARIILPQKNHLRQVKKMCKDNHFVFSIYSFCPIFLIVKTICLYIFYLFKFLFNLASLKKEMSKLCLWSHLREDVYKSFVGAVCFESLLYSQIFKYMQIHLNERNKIYYVYEGLGWEKILNNNLSIKTVGLVCSITNENLLNFFYDAEDICPLPNRLGVLGPMQKRQFGTFHNNVFIYGAGRYSHLKHCRKIKKTGNVLIALGYNKKESKELLSELRFMSQFAGKKIVVRCHPESRVDVSQYTESFSDLKKDLSLAKYVVASSDTNVTLEALANGCIVKIPVLRNFVPLNPLYGVKCQPSNVKKTLECFFEFVDEKEMIGRIRNA